MIFRRRTTSITSPAVSPEATCREVMRVLQLFLDGRVDEVTAARVTKHLEACRDCGLEASTYDAIAAALERRRPDVDRDAVARLEAFGRALGTNPPDNGDTRGETPRKDLA